MPGTTPNRGYPFPQDGDGLPVRGPAVDMELLARAVDADAVSLDDDVQAEAATRAAADVALQTNIDNVVHVGTVDNHILFQASLGNAVTDEVGKHLYTFPIPFNAPPIVVANNAVRDQSVHIGVEHGGVTATTCVVFAKKLTDGTPATDTNISWHWIAVGFRS
jgi:hypothetical protein